MSSPSSKRRFRLVAAKVVGPRTGQGAVEGGLSSPSTAAEPRTTDEERVTGTAGLGAAGANMHLVGSRELGNQALLVRSLQAGSGHVAVIGPDSPTAVEQARKALVEVNSVAVLQVSAAAVDAAASPDGTGPRPIGRVRNLMAPLLDQARAVERPALIVVEDADACDAEALERIRMAVECDPDSIKWLRLVLIGDERLERILGDPAASALSSRLCARVRVAPQAATKNSTDVLPALRLTALASFSAALVAVALVYFVPAARRTPQADNAPAQIAAARTSHADAANPPPASSVRSEVARPGNAAPTEASMAETSVAEAPTVVASALPPAAEPAANRVSHERADDQAAERKAGEVSTAASEAARKSAAAETAASEPAAKAAIDAKNPPPAKPSPVRTAAVRDAAKATASSKPAVAKSVAPVKTTKAGVLAKPAAPAAKAAPTVATPSRERVLEAGSFPDAKHAYALRYDVGTRFDDERVLVARVDREGGPPEYRVRVVGLESSRDEANAAAAIHDLGHDFVRYEKPGALQRFGRKVWAGLKGQGR